ncbi:MAG TPA: site-specific integrase [Opitutaceae bacterium]|jgi:integrase
MASLRRKPRSPFWFACFTLPDGTRTQRSTKLPDRKAATKLALQWEEAARNRITEAQARRVLSDIHEQIHGVRLSSPTVDEYAARWLARKQGETAGVTHAAYRHALDDFKSFLGDGTAGQLHYVTPSQVAAWRDASAAKATPRTANNKLKILRVWFQSAWRDGLLSDNPAAKVSTLKSAEGTRRPFTLPELKRLLAAASVEWRGMILAGFYTGQRLKDVASLTWRNVDLTGNQIQLSTSKTGRRQVLPIATPLRAYLDELPAGDDPDAPLFPSLYPKATKDGGSSPLSQQFYSLLSAANLAPARGPKRESTGKGRSAPRERNAVSFHSLRHTATSLLKAAGVSEAVTRDIIGHESAEISRHYTHTEESAKRDAVNKLPDLLKP